jgi:hypothetical protein
VRTPEIFMGEVSEMLQLEGVLQSADEVMETLINGAIVKSVHLYYPEVHWAKLEGDQVIERVVNSATGKVLPPVRFNPYWFAELVKNALEFGWIFCVAPDDVVDFSSLFGGEQE